MKTPLSTALCALSMFLSSGAVLAAPAIDVLGKDFTFPKEIDDLPSKPNSLKTCANFSNADPTNPHFSSQGDYHARCTC